MGKELEYKLSIPSIDVLEAVLADAECTALAQEDWRETRMETTYYDTAEHVFAAHHWTLRRRMENEKSIVCLKTPAPEAHTRGEWQLEAAKIDDEVIARLMQAGAPRQLLSLYADGALEAVCGASFLRCSRMLRFSDGSTAELAGDCGVLYGRREHLPFAEVELELCGGQPEQMLALVRHLCKRYGLQEERRSKHARARSLK